VRILGQNMRESAVFAPIFAPLTSSIGAAEGAPTRLSLLLPALPLPIDPLAAVLIRARAGPVLE
jgi:hypothetical protein